MTSGRSGLPSRNTTTTSSPTRGIWMLPKPPLAPAWATRTQQELLSLCSPLRSQWNCTFTRPSSSVNISSPGGPTMIAVCGPEMVGRGVVS
ncbi:hypothetical protein D9M71_644190 [compost metagenome]